MGRECNPLAFWVLVIGNQCHTHATNWAGHGQSGQLGGGRGSVEGEDIVHILGIQGHHGDHDLHLIAQTLHEGGAQWAVDLARGQDGLGAGAAFTTEEASRNATSGVETFFHIHGQGEEIDSLAWLAGCGGGGEEHGVLIQVSGDGAIGLAGQKTRFQADGAGSEITIINGGYGFPDSCVRVDQFSFDFLCAHSVYVQSPFFCVCCSPRPRRSSVPTAC